MKNTEPGREVPADGHPPVGNPRSGRAAVRRLATLLGLLALVGLAWWIVGRATSETRRLTIRGASEALVSTPGPGEGASGAPAPESDSEQGPAAGARAPARAGSEVEITVLTWNIAHGRGDVRQGWTNNWKGGSPEARAERLAAISGFIRDVDADLVILNEVDFSSQWSGGVNQAEVLAVEAGYPAWVEQRNFDFRLPFFSFAFGNALLTRLPILEAEWVGLPPRSSLEALAIGAKSAALVRVETQSGPLGVVPIHLEFREGDTRLRAAGVFLGLREREESPLVLAGDFNTAPSGWPGAGARTLLDSLLTLGWGSPRVRGSPDPREFTFPTPDPQDSRDWILVEPPLEVLETRVLRQAAGLSDHFPVLAVLRVRGAGGAGG